MIQICILYVLLACYVFFSCVYFERINFWLKIGALVLLVGCGLKFDLNLFPKTPSISPSWLMSLLDIAGTFLAVAFSFCVIRDILFCVIFIVGRLSNMSGDIGLRSSWTTAILLTIAEIVAIWGYYEATKVPEVREITMQTNRLPNGLRIVLVSDLHIEKHLDRFWLEQVVDKINSLRPDLVAITGDFADGRADEMRESMKALSGITSPVFGVSGNHEGYWNRKEWIELLNSLGVNMLDGKKVAMTDPQSDDEKIFTIGGIGDDEFKCQDSDILLVHRPSKALPCAENAGIVLAGHTHGGQMSFLRSMVAKRNAGMVSGQYGNIYINPGTGLWRGFMMRMGVPSEITLIKIKNSKEKK